jgi:hypothetical protein
MRLEKDITTLHYKGVMRSKAAGAGRARAGDQPCLYKMPCFKDTSQFSLPLLAEICHCAYVSMTGMTGVGCTLVASGFCYACSFTKREMRTACGAWKDSLLVQSLVHLLTPIKFAGGSGHAVRVAHSVDYTLPGAMISKKAKGQMEKSECPRRMHLYLWVSDD